MYKTDKFMPPTSKEFKRFGLQTSPWVLLSGVLILLAIVVVLAVQDISRERENMSRILIEKGAAWIKATEAGTRVGMRRMMRGEDHIQHLLEETAGQPDVLYVLVTDNQGVILAHNDSSLKGKPHVDRRSLPSADTYSREYSRVVDNADGQKVFEVFREFHPLTVQEIRRRLHRYRELGGKEMMGGMLHRQSDWFLSAQPDGVKRFIFIGLDISPFDQARKQDLKNTLILSSVLLLLGFGGYVSIFWVQNYRAARRSLQESTTFTDEVVASLPVGLMATDKEGRIAFFNAAAERITGMKREKVYGSELEDVLPPDWRIFREALERGDAIIEQEKECAFPGQANVSVSASAVRITSHEGLFLGNIVILRDITEVKRLQEEIRRTEKLAAIGGLAAGVAHEIRNPLSSIKGIATYFRDKLDTTTADRETAEVMIQEVDRLNRVISELLEFARPAQLKTRTVSLNELVRHAVQLVQPDARARKITIEVLETPQGPTLELDPDRFSQCLLNLYLNAIQAMQNGGKLSIRCSMDKHAATIEVSDTGHGINPADMQQIFNPYFTTKPSGTGLGLAIVHKIVEAHQGQIKVDSLPGRGTTFTVTLPRNGERHDG